MTFPTFLTISRIVGVVIIVACLLLPWPATRAAALVVFILAAITDWLDGFLARILNQASDLGRMLDPIADKLIVTIVLVMLIADRTVSGMHVVAVVLIIGREIFISGLREFLGGRGVAVHVSPLAKWKTTVQLVAIAALLFAPLVGDWSGPAMWAAITLLWVAAAISLTTGADYMRGAMPSLAGRTKE